MAVGFFVVVCILVVTGIVLIGKVVDTGIVVVFGIIPVVVGDSVFVCVASLDVVVSDIVLIEGILSPYLIFNDRYISSIISLKNFMVNSLLIQFK